MEFPAFFALCCLVDQQFKVSQSRTHPEDTSSQAAPWHDLASRVGRLNQRHIFHSCTLLSVCLHDTCVLHNHPGNTGMRFYLLMTMMQQLISMPLRSRLNRKATIKKQSEKPTWNPTVSLISSRTRFARQSTLTRWTCLS